MVCDGRAWCWRLNRFQGFPFFLLAASAVYVDFVDAVDNTRAAIAEEEYRKHYNESYLTSMTDGRFDV
jgi:hypothetical protein